MNQPNVHKVKGKNVRKSEVLFNTQLLLDTVFQYLCGDLECKMEWIDGRKYVGPAYQNAGPYTFKRLYQIDKFWKRIIPEGEDSFDAIRKQSLESFRDFQKNLRFYPENEVTDLLVPRCKRILQEVLGEFNFSEFSVRCRFGKKAAKGLKFQDSYLDNRIHVLTGSKNQFELFKCVVNDDIHLHRALRPLLGKFIQAEKVEVSAVPKSSSKARIICPDTVLGGFLSSGLGDYIRSRLELRTPIRLSRQPEIHKQLAREASINGCLATIDMKNASDSFTEKHISWLPESWQTVLKICRTPVGQYDGRSFPFKSFMLMGSGHTFPLQTLFFYAINKAALELLGSRAKPSVFGDDIIVPNKYARHCIFAMSNVGLTVNKDKSFYTGNFRESCGGDFHTGIAVRPFMLELSEVIPVRRNELAALIHKIYNGLCERWEWNEIPNTLSYLLDAMRQIGCEVNVVPSYESSYSGFYYVPEFVVANQLKIVDQLVAYRKLCIKLKHRKIHHPRIYYWYRLCPIPPMEEWLIKKDGQYVRLHEARMSNGQEPLKGMPTTYRWVLN